MHELTMDRVQILYQCRDSEMVRTEKPELAKKRKRSGRKFIL